MLGGPQAGIIAGKNRYIQALKRHPFFRAVRCDKLILTSLQNAAEAYLNNQSDKLPLHQFLTADIKRLKKRADRLAKKLESSSIKVTVSESQSQVGGGSLPQALLPSIAIDFLPKGISLKEFAAQLRRQSTPVIGVINNQRFRLDLKTIFPEQDKHLIESITKITTK